MRLLTTLLPWAALATAFVVPDEEMTNQIIIESQTSPQTLFDKIQDASHSVWADLESTFGDAVAFSSNALDSAINAASEVKEKFECYMSMTAFDVSSWLDSAETAVEDLDIFDHPHGPRPPPHRKPHRPPHHKPPHGHHKSNKTVYELIASSKYTTKLAKVINAYPDIVDLLNGTLANYTVFAPTDKAFAKLPKGHKKPSEEVIKKVLAYHVSPEFYPARRILISHTIPTTLGEDSLGGNPQRLRVGLSLRGLAVNFYSKIVAVDIFGSNGVIHGVDSILLPPPPAMKIISLLPGEFSTLSLALEKTGLSKDISEAPHDGGTLFAPSNWAFRRLGPKINAFLFSKYGEKYLKALLEYHVVANRTLYSDAFYGPRMDRSALMTGGGKVDAESIPKGLFHVDLPTLLHEKPLSIDVARYGGFISIKINGFSSVSVQDGLAKDGVIQVVSNVLIPPKIPGGKPYNADEDGEMDLEEFKERLLPFAGEL